LRICELISEHLDDICFESQGRISPPVRAHLDK